MKVRGVQVGILLTDGGTGEVRVSLRSRPGTDILRVAERFGGGGHRYAAGARVQGSLEAVEAQVLAAVGQALDRGCGRFLWRLLWLSCRAKSRHLAVNPLSSVSPDGKQQRTARSLHSSRLPPSHFVLRRTRRRDSVGMTTSFTVAACALPLFAAAT